MQIVIDIPDNLLENEINTVSNSVIRKALKNGTPLPEHHGRLIDVDVLVDGMEDDYEFCEAVNATPTIIPATKEKNCETCSKAWTDDCEKALCFRNNYCKWKPETKEGDRE